MLLIEQVMQLCSRIVVLLLLTVLSLAAPAWHSPEIISAFHEVRILSSRCGRGLFSLASKSTCEDIQGDYAIFDIAIIPSVPRQVSNYYQYYLPLLRNYCTFAIIKELLY